MGDGYHSGRKLPTLVFRDRPLSWGMGITAGKNCQPSFFGTDPFQTQREQNCQPSFFGTDPFHDPFQKSQESQFYLSSSRNSAIECAPTKSAEEWR